MLKLGWLALSLLVGLTVGAFYGLISFSTGFSVASLTDPYIQAILGFSLKQAMLSALVSVVLGYPIARALYYWPQLWGRAAFLSVCLLSFVMPTLVLITGLVSLLGKSGWLTPYLGKDWNLYGLKGILLAHVYLNVPFVVRALVLQLQTIPDSSWRLAQQLKFTPWQRWKLVEWPSVRGRLGVVAGFVFVLCFNSFAVVLALGGGPQATTLEVAIYQALKYEFNIAEALTLAWLQFGIAGVLFALMARFSSGMWLSPDTGVNRYTPKPSSSTQVMYALLYVLAWVVLLLPLGALVWEVAQASSTSFKFAALFKPTLITLTLSVACALSAVVLAYAVLLPVRWAIINRKRGQWMWEWLGVHTLVAPAMVLSVGLYMLLLRQVDLERWGMVWVWLINSALLTPFAVQQLRARVLQFDAQYVRLVQNLKLSTVERLRVEWPWLKASLGAAGVLVLLLAMGEVAIFAIFGSDHYTTLPWLIYSYAGSYRMSEAALASLVLLAWCALIVWGWERLRQRESQHAQH